MALLHGAVVGLPTLVSVKTSEGRFALAGFDVVATRVRLFDSPVRLSRRHPGPSEVLLATLVRTSVVVLGAKKSSEPPPSPKMLNSTLVQLDLRSGKMLAPLTWLAVLEIVAMELSDALLAS
jgi:hypothetical protein